MATIKNFGMITIDQLKKYRFENIRHSAYDETKDIAEHLKFHIDGYVYDKFDPKPNTWFQKLIDDRRPSETSHIQAYRREIYANVTQEPMFKVINSLKKIVKSEDWKIDYSQSLKPPKVKEDESFENYAENNFPDFNSIEAWAYSIGLKELIRDPNGIFIIKPQAEVKGNEFRKPTITFVPSEDIWDWTDEFIIYQSKKVKEWKSKSGDRFFDNMIIEITKNKIIEWTRTGDDTWKSDVSSHDMDKFPIVKSGGMIKKMLDNFPIYDSFLSPMLPRLDEAAREYSDLQAEVVQHIFSTMWYIETQDCKQCNGTGKVRKDNQTIVCGKCKGEGAIPKSPYKDFVIKKEGFGEEKIPVPPAGYIQKPIEIVKIQDERVDKHIFRALSSINMEFLAQTPLNQSGKAKEVDRDELNNFVYGVAYHFVECVIKPIYKLIAEYRYKALINDWEKMLPAIPVPERFDLISQDTLIQQISAAKEGKVDPVIISELQIDFINKKFRDNPQVREKLKLIAAIDPFPGLTNEEVGDMVLSGVAKREDAILSVYIETFVNQLMEEDEKFLSLPRNEARNKLLELAKKKNVPTGNKS